MKMGLRFNDMELCVFENTAPEILLSEDYSSENSEKLLAAYVSNILNCYLGEQIVTDIRNSGLSLNEEEALIDQIGNMDLIIPAAICNFYRDKCNMDLIMEEPSSLFVSPKVFQT